MSKNYFGFDKHSPVAIFDPKHQKVCDFVRSQLNPLFKDSEKSPDEIFQKIKDCLTTHELERAEKELNQLFEIDKQDGSTSGQLLIRADNIFKQIVTPIKTLANGSNTAIDIIDVGCGDGLVSHLLRTNAKDNNLNIGKTWLADTYDYRNSALRNNEYPFILLNEYYSSIDTQGRGFDCVLLLTVLHHSLNPKEIFKASCKILKPNGIVIIIESCIGITRHFVEATKSVTGKSILEDNKQKTAVEEFLKLSEDEQFLYATFIDWFYNRVLHKVVKVPYNFTTPGDWDERLSRIDNMEHLGTYCEGFDQITVPEFHTLHVFKKVEN